MKVDEPVLKAGPNTIESDTHYYCHIKSVGSSGKFIEFGMGEDGREHQYMRPQDLKDLAVKLYHLALWLEQGNKL